MTTFEDRKAVSLRTMDEHDRSKKGSVDAAVKPLLAVLNKHPDYYSTSSCAGRILLLHEPASRKKNAYAWPYVTHDTAQVAPFLAALSDLAGSEGLVWFRMQTVIVHVACRDLDCARALLGQFHSRGWKRSGIFSVENDVMVELLSVESLATPVMENGELLVSEAFLSRVVAIANEKLAVCHEKIAAATKRLELFFCQEND